VSDPRAEAARVLGADDVATGKLEVWAWLAFAVLAAAGGGVAYLGARPGGTGPIWFWLHGRFVLVLVALFLLLVGLVVGWRRPPFLQRRRGRAFLALVLVVGVLPLPMPYPTSKERTPSAVPFLLPLEGTWIAHQSGTEGGPLSAMTADRRYGLTFVHPDDLAREPRPAAAADFAGYGAPVASPAAGVVVWVRDGQPDRAPADSTRAEGPELGNVVVLEVADEQFLFLGHLRAGSLCVQVGDEVAAGQPVAEVGYSGFFRFTPVPNLALHLQSTPEERWGEAVPWTFRRYVSGDRAVERDVPAQGQAVRRDG